MNDPLFQPISINELEVKNRICMPAMHMGMAVDFEVTDQIVRFYAERAKGGAGLIVVGFATVDELSGNAQNIGAHRDAFIPGLSRLAAAINDNGARSAVQLNHAGRYNMSFFLDGRKPVAPSAIASRLTRETPRELSKEEIEEIVAAFALAAGRVRTAGFDAVEVLTGTGYLISEFLSPLTNRREDEYGGSLENRMRFGLEIMAAVRKTVGADYPIIARMNGNDFMPGGQGSEELKKWAVALDDAGVDALCINVGWHEARVPQIVSAVPRGVFAYLARDIRQVVNKPVIASHRINDPMLARRLIADGMCDMAAMGRSLIADPYLPQKAQKGRAGEIVHCIACAQGCFDHLFELKHVECLCNPSAGHESERIGKKTEIGKKVLVIGGGPAGMSAAVAAARRGHSVTLLEKDHRLGGQLLVASAPPGREEFSTLARDLAKQVDLSGVTVRLGCEVDEALLGNEKPDAVILATGAGPIRPDIPGADAPHVVQAWDVLMDKAPTGKKVVVLGGGAVGVETALFLSQKGTLSGEAIKFLLVNGAEGHERLYELATKGTKQVILVEMIERLGKDIGKSTRWGMLQDLSRLGIETRTNSKVMEITENGLKLEGPQGLQEIRADSIVLAAGSRPVRELAGFLEKSGIDHRVVGDAGRIGRAFEAVHQGFAAGNAV